MTAIPVPAAQTPSPRSPARSSLTAWFGGNMPIARLGLIINLMVPAALLIWDAHAHHLGADPVNYAIHTTGVLAVSCLLLSLVVTPLRMLTGFTWLVQFRRSLGVWAFYYACAHLSIYFWWDRQRSLSSTVHEITHRYYLALGFCSLSLMAPLWATSFSSAIRILGGKWWKRLHRLAYLAAALACWHFYLQSKADKRLPDVYIGILTVLLGYRLVAMLLHRRSMAIRAAAAPAAAPVAGKVRYWKGKLRVAGMFMETESVRTFRLVPEDGGEIPFRFAAGQFLNLSVEIEGKRVGRSYTIASPPTRDGYIELSIKREDRGRVSNYLHDMLMAGQSVEISAPAGRFTFKSAEAQRVLLIAGGVGITPVMSILRDLTDRCWNGAIDLIFSVRGPADVIFRQELEYLTARNPNLHVHVTITRDAPADWTGPRGRISASLVESLVPDFRTRPIFICGPTAMAEFARNELLGAGVDKAQIKLESFTPAAAVAVDNGMSPAAEMASGEATTVTFARSNKSAPLPANKSVLETAESVGVSIDYDCRSGICGRCRTKLLSGTVTMAVQDALSDGDIAEGFVLACQARASEPISVDA